MRWSVFILVGLLLAGCVRPSSGPLPAAPSAGGSAAPANTPPAVTGTKILSLDPGDPGKQSEVLFSRDDRLDSLAISPDGRYLLFGSLPPADGSKGDPLITPYVLDRTTDRLQPGEPLPVHYAAIGWSGHGFWVNWLVHLDLDMKVNTYPDLHKAILGDSAGQILSARFAADGQSLAAVVLPKGASSSSDLVWVNADGTNLRRMAHALEAWTSTPNPAAAVALSPTGDRLILTADQPRLVLVQRDQPESASWKDLTNDTVKKYTGPLFPGPSWSPDGQYAWIPGEMVNAKGERQREVPAAVFGIWTASSDALLIYTPDGYVLVGVSGGERKVDVPAGFTPLGFLRDGRLILRN